MPELKPKTKKAIAELKLTVDPQVSMEGILKLAELIGQVEALRNGLSVMLHRAESLVKRLELVARDAPIPNDDIPF